MIEKNVKAWVTKWALTQGILEVTGAVDHEISSTMLSWRRKAGYRDYVHGKDWHRTPEAALDRVAEMKARKIDSLRRSIKKMESLRPVTHKVECDDGA